MGYRPIEPKHHAAILPLVAPATPYANEPDGEQAGSTCSASTWNADAWMRLMTSGLEQGIIALLESTL